LTIINAGERARRHLSRREKDAGGGAMNFEEMFFYGMTGIGMILAVTVGLAGFLVWKAVKKR